MGPDEAISLMEQTLWTAALIGGPLLASTLIVGLLISVFQVTTQIQEITLSYVPKLFAAVALLFFLGGWMTGVLTEFARNLYIAIPVLVN